MLRNSTSKKARNQIWSKQRRSFLSWLQPQPPESSASRKLRFESLEDRRVLADGDLDALAFATSPPAGTPAGVARTNFSAAAVNDGDQVQTIGIQSTGKIIAAGNTTSAGAGQMALVRYNTDGTLDTSFGGAAMGKVVVPNSVFGALVSRSFMIDMVVTPTDKIVLVGGATIDAGGPCVNGMSQSTDWAIAVFNADGTPDMGFDTDGFKAVDFFTCADNASSIAVQPADGKILVIGSAFDFGVLMDQNDDKFLTILARFNTDGSPDATFNGGPGGVAGESRFLPPTIISVNDMVVLPVGDPNAGKIITVGTNGNFLMNRFTTTGALDSTFDTDGAVITNFPSGASSAATSVALYTDGTGRILLAGNVNSGSDFALARYNANGSLDDGGASDTDPSDAFDTDGKVVTNVSTELSGPDSAKFVGILSDGKIVATGEALAPMVPMGSGFPLPSLGIAKYNTDGTLDGTFGTGGTKVEHFGDSGMGSPVHQNRAQSAPGGALQSDGKILVGGQILAEFEDNPDFFVARFLNSVASSAGSLQFSAPTYLVGESGFAAIITVTRTGGSDGTVMVNVDTTDGTAAAPGDYADSDQVLTFGDGETTKTFTIPIVNDPDDEPNETVNLALSNPTGGAVLGSQSTAVLTITDNDGPPADLSVIKTGASTVVAGQNITYTLTVTNNGPSAAENVVVTDMVPANATFAGFSGISQGIAVFDSGSGLITASFGTVTVGTPATLTFVVTANASAANGTVITNSATATSDASDPNTGNNTGTANTTVLNAADLVVTKSGPANVLPGENITYTLTVTNSGPIDAQNVVLTDTVPANTTFAGFIDISQGIGVFNAGLITASFGTVTVGTPATLTFVVTTSASAPNGTIITNTATVASDTPDPNSANNTGTETTRIGPLGLPECEVVTLNLPGAPGTATLEDDADNPGSGVLIVTGTAGNDTIVIEPKSGQLRVTRNGKTIGTFAPSQVQHIVAFGLAGNDKIVVNASLSIPATLFGDGGNDYLFGAKGADGLEGGNGTDRLFGGSNNDTLCGGDGNDFVYGQAGNDFAGGEAGNDKVFGEAGNDFLLGNEGNDSVYGGTGNDRMYGQAGNDQVFGEAGNDIGVGGDGNDKLYGGSGRDVLIGGDGLDTLFGEGHDDILVAGSTSHDEDDEALQAILAEWASSNSYTTRVNNIRNGGGANGAFVLDDTTVIDDGLNDTLWGDGGLDWFLFGAGDKLKDKASSELVN